MENSKNKQILVIGNHHAGKATVAKAKQRGIIIHKAEELQNEIDDLFREEAKTFLITNPYENMAKTTLNVQTKPQKNGNSQSYQNQKEVYRAKKRKINRTAAKSRAKNRRK